MKDPEGKWDLRPHENGSSRSRSRRCGRGTTSWKTSRARAPDPDGLHGKPAAADVLATLARKPRVGRSSLSSLWLG